jgi:putative membrane protein
MTDALAEVWAEGILTLPLPVMILGAAWVVVMIAVPIWKWVLSDRGERIGISLGVIFQAATVAVLLGTTSLPTWRLLAVIIGVPFLGWLVERIGSQTGIPFGKYHYTDVLQPQIAHVPVIIPLAWLMMIPPSWAVATMILPDAPRWLTAIVAGAAFMAWDTYLDPQMVRWNFWQWDQPGRYVGIPLVNFAGWWLAGAVICFVLMPATVPVAPLFAIYIVTWLLELGGQAMFWKLPVSAATGFLAMGAFVVLTLAAW